MLHPQGPVRGAWAMGGGSGLGLDCNVAQSGQWKEHLVCELPSCPLPPLLQGAGGQLPVQKPSRVSLHPGDALDPAPTLRHRWEIEAPEDRTTPVGTWTWGAARRPNSHLLSGPKKGANTCCRGGSGGPSAPPPAWPACLLGARDR